MSGFDPDVIRAKTVASSPSLDEAPVRAELRGGERLLWVGRPVAALAFVRGFALYFFAIPWTAFSLFWEGMALSPWFFSDGEIPKAGMLFSIIFPLFGLPFIAIGFFMLAKPFTDAARARKTLYALTDHRALIVVSGSKPETTSYPLATMAVTEISRKEGRNGQGSLFFASRRTVDSDGDVKVEAKGFEHIENVRDVEAKLTRALSFFESGKGAE